MHSDTELPILKHCKQCGASFESFSRRRLYCTDCLVVQGRRIITRKCTDCGAAIEIVLSMAAKQERVSTILCRRCRREHNRKIIDLVCASCGRRFERGGQRGKVPLYCRGCRRRLNNTKNLTGVCSKCGGRCDKNAAQCKACSLQPGARVRLDRKPCQVCGRMFQPKTKVHRYCGAAECAKIGSNQVREERYGLRNWFICLYCGEPYKAKSKERDRFCCREHSFLWTQENPVQGPQLPPGPMPPCEICGEPVNNRNAKTCGAEQCKRTRYVLREVARSQRDRRPRPCKECGQVFTPEYGNKRRFFCSDKCLSKKMQRIGKAVRRSRIRNASAVESVDPILVFQRDGWRCKLCGCKTPKRLRGTTDDSAPELDHVVPLALGGAHTYANVQCLCRRCNQAKGATVAGQLSLL